MASDNVIQLPKKEKRHTGVTEHPDLTLLTAVQILADHLHRDIYVADCVSPCQRKHCDDMVLYHAVDSEMRATREGRYCGVDGGINFERSTFPDPLETR